MNKLTARFVFGSFASLLIFFGTGCMTMDVQPLNTGDANSYTQHQEKNGITIGVQPFTDKHESKALFKMDLLDKGLLPILIVAENQSASSSFIIAKEKVVVMCEASGVTSASEQKNVTSGKSTAGTSVLVAGTVVILASPVAALPLVVAGMKMASDATVLQHNLADKEFYSRTIKPGEKAQGFVYFQFSNDVPPTGNYHVVAEVKNSATGEITTFDFPVNLNLPNK